MTRIEEFFNREMELASRMKRVERPVYWLGYSAGVMRGLFGTVAVDDRLHETWVRTDAMGEAACGYRDGYDKLANCPRSP